MLRKILSLVSSYDRRFFAWLEGRVSRHESLEYDADRMFEEWTEESFPELDDASYAQRLEEEERDQGSRTTQLPVEPPRVLQTNQRPRNLIPDPWDTH
jgi:hypothetical protein